MTDFEYTKLYEDFDSSWIDGVYYNENDSTAVIETTNSFYLYSDVPESAVEDLVNADSVGSYYNTVFQSTFGPSEHLGQWVDVEPEEVPVLVKKDFDSTPVTKEFSLTLPETTVAYDEGSITYNGTKQYSLQTPLKVAEEPELNVTSTVFFTLDGGDRIYSFESNAEGLQSALHEVDAYVKRLGAKGKVTKVEFVFE